MANQIIINIKNHSVNPNEKVIEIMEENKLIATIIPRSTEIIVVSKYIKSILETQFPQKATILLDKK